MTLIICTRHRKTSSVTVCFSDGGPFVTPWSDSVTNNRNNISTVGGVIAICALDCKRKKEKKKRKKKKIKSNFKSLLDVPNIWMKLKDVWSKHKQTSGILHVVTFPKFLRLINAFDQCKPLFLHKYFHSSFVSIALNAWLALFVFRNYF